MVKFSYSINDANRISAGLEVVFNLVIPNQVRVFQFDQSLAKLSHAITAEYPTAVIQPYGSFGANVALGERSDLDVSVKIQTTNSRATLWELRRILDQAGFQYIGILMVEARDIWGLNGWDNDYRVWFDMTFNNHDGPLLSSVVRSAASNVVCRKLVVLVKQFVKVQNISDCMNGTLKSIGYCLLCISFLQEMDILPRIHIHESKELAVQQRDAEKFETDTREFRPACIPEISDLLYMFFRYYLYDFDFTEYAVTINKTRPIKKAALGFPHVDAISGAVINGNTMVISSPFQKEENIASAVNAEGMKEIRDAFETACKRLRNGGTNDIFYPFK